MFNFMQKLVSIGVLLSMFLVHVPQARAADLYANELVDTSVFDLLTPANAVGEPDQQYADFRDQDTFLKLDMGAGEEGRDGLTLFVLPLDYGAAVVVTFYSADNTVLGSVSRLFDPGMLEWTAVYYGTESFRYVKIASPETEQWRLDAVQAVAIDTPVAEPSEVDPPVLDETPAEIVIQSNDLIKLESSSAIYVVGDDGLRHPFPDEVTLSSWGYSFAEVITVEAETMASYTLGAAVTVKPGSYLVKIQPDEKVYAVAPNHTLRWVTSEAMANELFGSDWPEQILDVSVALWPRYTMGENIEGAVDLEGWEVETQPY